MTVLTSPPSPTSPMKTLSAGIVKSLKLDKSAAIIAKSTDGSLTFTPLETFTKISLSLKVIFENFSRIAINMFILLISIPLE